MKPAIFLLFLIDFCILSPTPERVLLEDRYPRKRRGLFCFERVTVWLTQAQMVRLFDKDQSVIARHIKNVFKEGELPQESNMQILHITLSKFKPTTVYSLDVIISVGYRVKSFRGTQFRQWANQVLKDFMLKGNAIRQRKIATDLQIADSFQDQ